MGGHFGRYQLGDAVPLVLGLDTLPAAAPSARIYRGSALAAAAALTLDDDLDAAARFRGVLDLGAGHAIGRHVAVYHYVESGVPRAVLAAFEVAPGGAALGPVIAGLAIGRPEADVVAAHLGAGRLAAGRLPYLDEGVDG